MANVLGRSPLASEELLARTEALAAQILKAAALRYPPVPENIVLYLGPEAVIEYFDWKTLVGAVTFVWGRWVFGINRNDPPGRRRFTLHARVQARFGWSADRPGLPGLAEGHA